MFVACKVFSKCLRVSCLVRVYLFQRPWVLLALDDVCRSQQCCKMKFLGLKYKYILYITVDHLTIKVHMKIFEYIFLNSVN